MENGLLAKRQNSIIDNLMPTATKKMKEMASYVLSENDTSQIEGLVANILESSFKGLITA